MNKETRLLCTNDFQKFYMIPQVSVFFFSILVLLGYYIFVLNFIFIIFRFLNLKTKRKLLEKLRREKAFKYVNSNIITLILVFIDSFKEKN
jgi:predicted transcriptional regulator